MSQFLAELDGIEELKGILVLGGTNRLDRLDPAVLRPGRFDEVVRLSLPGERERREILSVHLRGKPLAPGISPAALASRTEGFSGAEIAALCRKTAQRAVRRTVRERTGSSSGGEELIISLEDLKAVLEEMGQE